MLEAARNAGRLPVVYTSSAAVYGDNPDLPLCESARTAPLTAYGVDKLASEMHARIAGQVHGVPCFVLRLFNVYGPRQRAAAPYSGVIATFVDRMRNGRDVTVDGEGNQVRDFVYVDDAVDHLIAGMTAATPSAPIVNLCTGTGTSIRQLAATLQEMTGFAGPVAHGPARVADIRDSVGNPDRAIACLGLRTRTALPDGLARLLEFAADRQPTRTRAG